MPSSPPSPPSGLPEGLVGHLESASADQLRRIASYAAALADYRDQQAQADTEASGDTAAAQERPEDVPDDVPAKATLTIKEINDNRYYYWQWREGETIRSQYKGPVTADE